MWIKTHGGELIDTGGALIKLKGKELKIKVQGEYETLATYKTEDSALAALTHFEEYYINSSPQKVIPFVNEV